MTMSAHESGAYTVTSFEETITDQQFIQDLREKGGVTVLACSI